MNVFFDRPLFYANLKLSPKSALWRRCWTRKRRLVWRTRQHKGKTNEELPNLESGAARGKAKTTEVVGSLDFDVICTSACTALELLSGLVDDIQLTWTEG